MNRLRVHIAIWTQFAVLLLDIANVAATAADSPSADPPAIADKKTYLADVVTQLDKTWPQNRTIKIVTHGHSVPAGYFRTPVVDSFNAYPHLLHQRLKAEHPHAVMNVVVTAIGGENSIGGAARFEKDVLPLRPDVVTIDYSLNDRGIGLDKAKQAWSQMIEQALSQGSKVILLTGTADTSAKLDDANDPLNQHAAQIRELAAKYHVGLVDSFAEFAAYAKHGGQITDLMSQGNHPNRKGHDLVVDELLAWFPASVQKQTYIYKTVGDVKIEADVYRPAGNELRPVVVWIHGGALIVGSRSQVPRNLLEFCADERLILVSLDYRLAPEVKLPEITSDLKDAFQWLHRQGPKEFQADTSCVIVAGGSAGGFLTMLAGAVVTPKPRALVAYWGYGDIDGPWTRASSKHHGLPVMTEDALSQVNQGRVLTNTDEPALQKGRGNYYRYLRQIGGWSFGVTGIDPAKEPGKLDPFCPVKLIARDYPPILMIHGTEDTDVPYSCSTDMAFQLKQHGVAHELVTIPGAEHGLRDGDPKLVAEAYTRAWQFIREQLRRP